MDMPRHVLDDEAAVRRALLSRAWLKTPGAKAAEDRKQHSLEIAVPGMKLEPLMAAAGKILAGMGVTPVTIEPKGPYARIVVTTHDYVTHLVPHIHSRYGEPEAAMPCHVLRSETRKQVRALMGHYNHKFYQLEKIEAAPVEIGEKDRPALQHAAAEVIAALQVSKQQLIQQRIGVLFLGRLTAAVLEEAQPGIPSDPEKLAQNFGTHVNAQHRMLEKSDDVAHPALYKMADLVRRYETLDEIVKAKFSPTERDLLERPDQREIIAARLDQLIELQLAIDAFKIDLRAAYGEDFLPKRAPHRG